MKKLILSLALTFCSIQFALAQDTPPAPDAAFKANINLAVAYEKTNQSTANAYYKKALDAAQNDIQKAEAQLGIGKTTPLHAKDDDPKNENAARLAAFDAVLKLPEANSVQKNEARLGIGETQFTLEQFDAALANFDAVANDANGTQPQQRIQARTGGGETLVSLKRYDEACTRLNEFLQMDGLTAAQKTAARRLMARSYLGQNNPRAAQAELKKLIVPTLKDAEAAQVYFDNGDFLREQKQPALARANYELVPALADATSEANIKALLQIGASYFDEKNYEKAREMWRFVPEMHGTTDKFRGDAWHSIGVSYAQEKNYAAAREAFSKWRDSNDDIRVKLQAWEIIASTFIEEKNYAGAREALTNVGKLGETLPLTAKNQLKIREKMGFAQTYRAEANFAQAATIYKEILDSVPVGKSDPSYYYEVRNQAKAAADEMAKEPTSMDAAFSLYEAWEKLFPYEFNKGEANMAMGDILVAQGKKDEAKAKYQRVIELRKNYDDAKIAQQKIDKLDGKAN